MALSVETFLYTPERRSEVEPDLVAWLGEAVAQEAFWELLLAQPTLRQEAVVAARDDEGRLALAFATRRPMAEGDARLVFYMLPQADDAHELGAALVAAMGRALAACGVTRQAVSLAEEKTTLRAVLEGCGFQSHHLLHRMSWECDGTPLPERSLPGIEASLYEGGDAALDAELAELWSRSFAGEALYSPLEVCEVERMFRDDGAWMMVARQMDSGRVVGASEAGDGNFFTAIAVARSHWGRGVAELVAEATMNEFRRRGHSRLISLVRPANAASIALHERMGWRRSGTTEVFLGPRIVA